MEPKDRLICALDVPSLEEAKPLAETLVPYVGCSKVGLELATAVGAPAAISCVRDVGGTVFYDGKFMDIPNTVAGAARAVTTLGVRMFNVHCLGGPAMMRAALVAATDVAEKKEGLTKSRPLILGVTILTSLDYDDLVKLGVMDRLNIDDPNERAGIQRDRLERLAVRHLAWLAQETGLDEVIASPQEIKAIREYCQPELLVVTPGVRPAWAAAGDQKRVMTPEEAIAAGADYLVVGRPLTRPPREIGSVADAAKRILDEIDRGLAKRERRTP